MTLCVSVLTTVLHDVVEYRCLQLFVYYVYRDLHFCYNLLLFMLFLDVAQLSSRSYEPFVPDAALSSATLDKLFTHIVQRLWCYSLMALYISV